MFQRRSFGHSSYGAMARSPLNPPRRNRATDPSPPTVHTGSAHLRLGLWLVPLVLRRNNPLRAALESARGALRGELGIDVPPVDTSDDLSLEGNAYVLSFGDAVVCRGTARVERMLAVNAGEVVRRVAGHATVDPVHGHDAIWIERREHHRAMSAGYHVHEPAAAIAAHVTAGLRQVLTSERPSWSMDTWFRSLDPSSGQSATLAEVRRRVEAVRQRRSTGAMAGATASYPGNRD